MDRGACRATVHGVARVRHDLVTKPPPHLDIGKKALKSPENQVRPNQASTSWEKKALSPNPTCPPRLSCVHPRRAPQPSLQLCTSGSVPWKFLPFLLFPSHRRQLSWFPPRRVTWGQQDLARECRHSLFSGPDLQVGFEMITSVMAGAACSSETFQSSQESPWDKHKVLANFKCN